MLDGMRTSRRPLRAESGGGMPARDQGCAIAAARLSRCSGSGVSSRRSRSSHSGDTCRMAAGYP